MNPALKTTARLVAASAAAVVLGGLGYIVVTWVRYGKTSADGRGDPLLDRFMPSYEIREQHEIKVAAPAEVTYSVAHELDLQRSGLIRAIFRGRELLMGADPTRGEQAPNFLSEVIALGWRVLGEEPGNELVMGAVTQPWKAAVVFRGLPPDEFAGFTDPGYAKIVWNMAVDARGPASSVFRTETRVTTTDAASRARFRRYWSVVSPGVLLIRREALKLVKREAERRVRTSARRLPPLAEVTKPAELVP